jgi:hypothetical protein
MSKPVKLTEITFIDSQRASELIQITDLALFFLGSADNRGYDGHLERDSAGQNSA